MEGALSGMNRKKLTRILLIVIIIFIATSFYYLPFYVSKPGIAKELNPIIAVENGFKEKGNFMLTTVRMGKANIYSYLFAKLSKYQEIYRAEEVKGENETDEEYSVRQLHLMSSSKQNAIEVAYKKAGIPVIYKYKGVYVLNVILNMPADGHLRAGDRIYKVDGLEFQSSTDFISYVSEKKAGDHIKLTYERNKEIKETEINVTAFKDPEQEGRVGIGIGLVDDKELKVDPEVTINTDKIGGPSAGFMFSLEIYNQLIEKDLTKGFDIAGTGTITPTGIVGRIGGIEQKVIAADKAGAEFFLAPNENGMKDSNYQNAVRTAKDIGTDMKIIPIDTFDQAVEFLDSLKVKR